MKKLIPIFALLSLCLPAHCYTSYKTVSFGAGQTGQTVTYSVENSAGAAVTTGVSGAVVELGGGAYGAAITVPDGANYFVVWSETNVGTTYTASDKIEAQAVAALPTLANQATVLTQVAKIGTNAADSPNEVTAQTGITNANTSIAALPSASTITTSVKGGSAPSWYTAPPSLPGDFLSVGEQASLTAAAGNTPAATVAAIKSDTILAKTFNRPTGKFTYNETTKVMTLLNDDGTTMGTVTLTVDPSTGAITAKQ